MPRTRSVSAAVYRHFADKAALIAAVAERGFSQLAVEFERVSPREGIPSSPGEARGRLAGLGEAYLRIALRTPGLFRLMFGPEAARCRAAAADRSASEGRESSYRYLERAVFALADTGAIPSAPDDADVMAAWALVHGYANLILGGIHPAAEGDLRSTADQAAGRIVRQLGG